MTTLLLLVELAALATAGSLLHAARRRIGWEPFYLYVGGLFAYMQLVSFLQVEMPVAGGVDVFYSSSALFPPLLHCILLVYVLDSARETRRLVLGLGVLTLALIAWSYALHHHARYLIPDDSHLEDFLGTHSRPLVASMVAIAADVLLISILFQTLENHLRKVPLWLRAAMAYIGALQLDAILYPALAFGSLAKLSVLEGQIYAHLWAKGMAGLVLGVITATYLGRQRRRDHGTLTEERGAFDILRVRERLQEMELLLDESETRLRTLLDRMVDGAVLVRDLRCLYANPAFARMTGREVRELMGQTILPLWPEPDQDDIARCMTPNPSGSRPLRNVITQIRSRAGTAADVEVCGISIWADGRPGCLGIVRDITEQMRMQAQLQQAEKLESLGTLAGGLAHDFNNILAGILGSARVAHDLVPAEHPALEPLSFIEEAAQRGRRLTERLLSFGRSAGPMTGPVDIREVLRAAESMARPSLDPRIRFQVQVQAQAQAHAQVEAEPVLPPVLGIPSRLEQAVMNLVLNARDAMPDGGRLVVTASRVERSEWPAGLAQPSAVSPDGDVRITVTDTGCGIQPEHLPRVFDPFFSTKGPGRGTGLGLAMVYGIVRSHQGTVDVRSRPGEGTTFTVYLPGASARPAETVSPQPPALGASRVLFVDDESSLRWLARRMLEPRGLEVHTAGSGEEALEIWARHGPFDAVVMDLIMPGLCGTELFHRIRELGPEVPVVVSTGFFGEENVEEMMASRACHFLRKPYGPTELLDALAIACAPAHGEPPPGMQT